MTREISFKKVRYPRKREFKLDKLILYILLGVALILLLAFLFNGPNGSGEVISEEQNQQEEDTAVIRFVIEIIDAWHLDENIEVISNIYPEVSALDDVWSDTIHDEEYTRITFEEQLTSANDITIYPRVVSGNPKIEVYEENKNNVIATFDSIVSNEYNKVFLTNLQGSQDTFDLKVLDGSVEFDYIIDPIMEVKE